MCMRGGAGLVLARRTYRRGAFVVVYSTGGGATAYSLDDKGDDVLAHESACRPIERMHDVINGQLTQQTKTIVSEGGGLADRQAAGWEAGRRTPLCAQTAVALAQSADELSEDDEVRRDEGRWRDDGCDDPGYL